MIQAEGLRLPGYIRDVAKADSGPMNVRGPQKKGNPLQSETPQEASQRPPCQKWSGHSH